MKRILTLAAVLSLAACGPYQLNDQERSTAELGAREIADRSQADFVGCSGQDSDKDGYVTCTIKDRSSPKAEHELACAYASRGCKRKA
ncbi:MAG: hypothetical protein WAP03_21745 [Methylorubrum rhodinum]|uniref:hypothetical protein n=1 Tax=Methylorubrum rhodinum TaxID=29428 RepID=UPI003BAE8D4B